MIKLRGRTSFHCRACAGRRADGRARVGSRVRDLHRPWQHGRLALPHDRHGSSADLYNPATGTWTVTGSMSTPRVEQIATLLADGEVLVAGGLGASAMAVSSAELYNPATGPGGPLPSGDPRRVACIAAQDGRVDSTATLLGAGDVLVSGGLPGTVSTGRSSTSALLYDPASSTWTATCSLNAPASTRPRACSKTGRSW
jgi:hypothetical protein